MIFLELPQLIRLNKLRGFPTSMWKPLDFCKLQVNHSPPPFLKGGGEQKSRIFEKGGLAEGQKKGGLTKRGGWF